MITGIDHIEIIVRNLQDHIKFYETMGFKVVRWTEHHGKSVELALPGEGQFILELHELLLEEVPGVNHIAYRTTDVDAAHAGLKEAGFKFSADVHESSTGRKKLDLRDPDGNRLQVVHPKRKAVTELK